MDPPQAFAFDMPVGASDIPAPPDGAAFQPARCHFLPSFSESAEHQADIERKLSEHEDLRALVRSKDNELRNLRHQLKVCNNLLTSKERLLQSQDNELRNLRHLRLQPKGHQQGQPQGYITAQSSQQDLAQHWDDMYALGDLLAANDGEIRPMEQPEAPLPPLPEAKPITMTVSGKRQKRRHCEAATTPVRNYDVGDSSYGSSYGLGCGTGDEAAKDSDQVRSQGGGCDSCVPLFVSFHTSRLLS